MGELSPWHWLIIVLVFVLLFGAKRLPDAARSLGKSMRILKTEVKGLHDDDAPADAGAPGTPAAALPPAPATPPPPAPVTTDAAPNAAATSTAGESTDAR